MTIEPTAGQIDVVARSIHGVVPGGGNYDEAYVSPSGDVHTAAFIYEPMATAAIEAYEATRTDPEWIEDVTVRRTTVPGEWWCRVEGTRGLSTLVGEAYANGREAAIMAAIAEVKVPE